MSDPEYILLSNSIRGAEKKYFEVPNKRTFEKMLRNSSFSNWAIFGHFWSFEANFGILDFLLGIVHVCLLGTLE